LVEGKELDEKRIALLEESKNLEAKKLANQRQVNYILSAVAVLLLVGLVFLVRSTRQKASSQQADGKSAPCKVK
jgi:hypothetical protein